MIVRHENYLPSVSQQSAIADVLVERMAQDKTHGTGYNSPATWLALLMEEVGEVAQVLVKRKFGGPHPGVEDADLHLEVMQVAAVAVAWLEQLHRQREEG
jgi:NTP pyrophosphatase (non-canonical NTP hydrolase)